MKSAFASLLAALTLIVVACGSGGSDTTTKAPGQPTSAPTARPSTSQPSAPPVSGVKLTTTPLVTKPLQPSTTDQQVSWNNQVTVTVPGGFLEANQALTIGSVTGLPNDPLEGSREIATFNISLGNQTALKRSVLVEMTYDPAKLEGVSAPEDSLYAAWWDSQFNVWHRQTVQVDTARNVAIIRVDHLTPLRLGAVLNPTRVKTTKHFSIAYNSKKFPILGKAEQDPEAFAQRVGVQLESAWTKYAAACYQVLPAATNETYIIDGCRLANRGTGKTWVEISSAYEEAETSTWFGDITLPTKYDDVDVLRQTTAHELFHTLHRRQVGMFTYVQSQWWAEAVADYAAAIVAWGNPDGMDKIPQKRYFSVALDTVNKDLHQYKTARFIEYLVQQGVDFHALFGEISTSDSSLAHLDTYLQYKTNKSLEYYYRGFAAHTLFSSAGPLEPFASGVTLLNSGVPEEPAPKSLAANVKEISYPLGNDGNYTARLWGFTVATNDPKATRALKVEFTGGDVPAANYSASVYVLKNDARSANDPAPAATLTASSRAATITTSANDTVYILVINADKQAHLNTIKVTEAPAGTWVLVKREVGQFGDPKRNPSTVSGNTAKVPFVDLQGEVSSWTCSWPEPPQTLEIGQKWGGTVTVQDAGSKPSERYWALGMVAMTAPGGLSVTATGTVAPVPGKSSSAQQSFSWTIPQDQMFINVRCSASTSQPDGRGGGGPLVAGVDYSYQLRK